MTDSDRQVVSGRPTPIRHVKAADLIVAELRRMIVLDGRPGDFLPSERLLIEKFSVSRPTLREAIRVLESEGLVEIRRGVRGGAVIKEPSIHDLAHRFGVFLQMHGTTGGEIFALRAMVEPAAAALAADDPESAREPLAAVLAYEAELVERIESDETVSVVLVEFHDTILDLCKNTALAAVGRLLDVIVTHHTHDTLSILGKRGRQRRVEALQKSHAAHQRISQAILRGDRSRAERLMRDHLAAVQHVSPPAVAQAPIDILGPGLETRTEWPRFAPRTTLD